MIGSILLLLLIVLAVSACLFFLFCMFIPSLPVQQVSQQNPVFSEEELDYVKKHPDYTKIALPNTNPIPLNLLTLDMQETVKNEIKTQKKGFSFWKKCYNIFHRI